MDAWLATARDAIAAGSGEVTLEERDADTLLELARLAAHTSGDRRNAPLLCYLVGIAVARGGELDSIATRIREL